MSLVALFGDTILTSAGRLSTITIMLTTLASFEKKVQETCHDYINTLLRS